MSAPAASALRNAYIVSSPPWCAMFITGSPSHGFWAAAGAAEGERQHPRQQDGPKHDAGA